MTRTIYCLDHGFVRLRNIAGPTRREWAEFDAHDVDAPNAARFSFEGQDRADRPHELDIKLAHYLMSHWHTGPFEQVVIWFEMKLPIFIARQFVRHRTARLNEASGRYVQLPNEYYIPKLEDVLFQAENKKQGGRETQSDAERYIAKRYIEMLTEQCVSSYKCYEQAIGVGIAMEQARLFLHLNHYTHWIFQIDLHNFMNMIARRDHPGAQEEAQVYAQAMDQLVRNILPETMKIYDEYRRF